MKRRGIFMRVPEKYMEELLKIKGKDTWFALIRDGTLYRGHEVDWKINTWGRSKYNTHYYCSVCGVWYPQELFEGNNRFDCSVCGQKVRTASPQRGAKDD